ncbi:hypothetical protein [Halorussus caseinilyticus]|uniref:Uncharacterized protein n=1 Tax=Halorussus caseinilyticus TaxID=3034025 RepID=A0ABD5WLG6_9EURY|nr:hypothetical protein [Halorussus sp. DT72]
MSNDQYRRGGREEPRWGRTTEERGRGDPRSPEQVESAVKRRMQGEELLIPVGDEDQSAGGDRASFRYGAEARQRGDHVPRESSRQSEGTGQPSQNPEESRHGLQHGGESRHQSSHAGPPHGGEQFSERERNASRQQSRGRDPSAEQSPERRPSPQQTHQQTPTEQTPSKQPHQRPTEGNQRPTEQPHQRPADDRSYSRRLEESRRRTEGPSGDEQARSGSARTRRYGSRRTVSQRRGHDIRNQQTQGRERDQSGSDRFERFGGRNDDADSRDARRDDRY